ncbi:MAG: hypothetical protein JST59_02895 [Actinobacteria bacterium]|nr:hypothetical protein [Actinomycetota bacterium]
MAQEGQLILVLGNASVCFSAVHSLLAEVFVLLPEVGQHRLVASCFCVEVVLDPPDLFLKLPVPRLQLPLELVVLVSEVGHFIDDKLLPRQFFDLASQVLAHRFNFLAQLSDFVLVFLQLA